MGDEQDDLRGDIVKAFEGDAGAQAEPLSPADAAVPAKPEAGPDAGAQPSDAPGRARDAQGRFAKQEIDRPIDQLASQAVQRAEAATGKPASGAQQQPQPGAQAPAGPPPGWSVQGKAAFDKLPDAVKADIARREVEVAQGLAKLTEYKGLDEFVSMARNNGTTLPEALARYVNAENALEADPISGLLWLCQRYQVHPAYLVQAIQGGQGNQTPDPSVQQIDPRLAGQFKALENRVVSMEREREAMEDQAINSQIHAFASDPSNRFFENVRHDMAHIIRTAPQNERLTLQGVYEKACWNHPEIREVLISERNAKLQNGNTRRADEIRRTAGRSLPSGSPVINGTINGAETVDPKASLRDDIRQAFDIHRDTIN